MAATNVPSGSPMSQKKWSGQKQPRPPLFNPLHRPEKK